MQPISDLVRLSKLETQFSLDPEYTQHSRWVLGSALDRRKIRKDERWRKGKRLSRGSFGDVWLQQCIYGDRKGEIRAVKEIQKLGDDNHHRELEAIALFSHEQYEQCFVKSHGWYDDDDSIFITMEYLPNGDLYKYLGSPLQEKEGQSIISQVLEGLKYMHQTGFTHRDLKPANILVVCEGPNWWVKIADFGISKRTIEDLTALRTRTGTPAFTAPEISMYGSSNAQYTSAVDIWAVGMIAFLILTGKTLFMDHHQGQRERYIKGEFAFPSADLLMNNVSREGCNFVKGLMAVKAEDRPGAEASLQSPWLVNIIEPAALETERTMMSLQALELSENESIHLGAEASASWSANDQSLPYTPNRSMDTIANKADLGTLATSTTENYSPSLTLYEEKETVAPRMEKMTSETETMTQAHIKLPAVFRGHSSPVLAIAFSPDGKQISSASGNMTVRLWDVATGTASAILEGRSDLVSTIAFSPDSKQIASSSGDGTVKLWDLATGTSNILIGHSNLVYSIAFSSNGKQIASASRDMRIRLWDLAARTASAILEGHSDWVLAVAFSPDGRYIASAAGDRTVRLWELATGRASAIFEGHSSWVNSIAFSPDSKQIALASKDKTVRLWDVATGTASATLRGHLDWVLAVAFSPDGKQIASGSKDMTVRLWDVATETSEVLKGHSGSVSVVTFSPDGKQVASASQDMTVRLWGLATTGKAVKDGLARKTIAAEKSELAAKNEPATTDGAAAVQRRNAKTGTAKKYFQKIFK